MNIVKKMQILYLWIDFKYRLDKEQLLRKMIKLGLVDTIFFKEIEKLEDNKKNFRQKNIKDIMLRSILDVENINNKDK